MKRLYLIQEEFFNLLKKMAKAELKKVSDWDSFFKIEEKSKEEVENIKKIYAKLKPRLDAQEEEALSEWNEYVQSEVEEFPKFPSDLKNMEGLSAREYLIHKELKFLD